METSAFMASCYGAEASESDTNARIFIFTPHVRNPYASRAAVCLVAEVLQQCLQSGMSVEGSCHCGAVRVEVATGPAWVADCNCSLCRKLAWRVAYYPPGDVRITGETTAYVWGDRMIGIHHCPVCGCGTHWETLGEDFGKMGVNARLLDDYDEATVEVRKVDNAD